MNPFITWGLVTVALAVLTVVAASNWYLAAQDQAMR